MAATELDPQEALWSRKSGTSMWGTAAEWQQPGGRAFEHTQLSLAFLNPWSDRATGFSKMTVTWRIEAEALNSAELCILRGKRTCCSH